MEVWILFHEEIEAPSAEAYEVRRFVAEARTLGIELKVFHPDQFDLLVTDEARDTILIDGIATKLPDVLLPRTLLKDTGYFPLAVIRQFERQGVLVYNNAACIEAVADKLHTHQILVENHLPTPVTMMAKFPADMALIEAHIGFPVVVKTLLGANGSGVFLIQDAKAFKDLMDLIGETSPGTQLIFQKYIASSHGRDLRLFVVDGEVIASMERRAADGGFKANFSTGGTVHEFVPDQEAIDLAVRTAAALNIQVAGIDLLFTDGGYTICEANTFPGFRGLEQACGVNVPQEIFFAMQKKLAQKRGICPTTVIPFDPALRGQMAG